jgi:hypothetical protein
MNSLREFLSSGVQFRPNPSEFFLGQNSLKAHCFGGEEKPSVSAAYLRHVKDPSSGVKFVIVGNITGHLSPTDRLFTAICFSLRL